VNFSEHYNIHYITFTILVRETCNDYQIFENAILFMRGKRSRYDIRRAECGLREEFARFHDSRDYY
jgi:hypothetical protein